MIPREQPADGVPVGPRARSAVRRALLREALHPRTGANRIGIQVRLAGHLDPDRLDGAFAALARRIATLRLGAALGERRPDEADDAVRRFDLARVFVAAEVVVHVPRIDLSEFAPIQQDAALRDAHTALLDDALPLDRPPLWRAQLFRLAPDRHVLQLAFHALVTEREGVRPFVHALLDAYARGDRADVTSPDPLDVAVDPGRRAAAWRYWQAHLEDPEPSLHLPTDRPRATPGDCARHTLRAVLPQATLDTLETFGRADHVLLAAFATLLHRLGASDRVRIGLLEPDPPEALLPMTALRLLELDLGPALTPAGVVEAVAAEIEAARAHADVDLAELVCTLTPAASAAPLVQVGFEARPPSEVATRYGDLEVSVREPTAASTWDLLLRVEASPSGAWLQLDYDPHLFRSETAERLLSQLRTVIDGFVRGPSTAIRALPLVSPAERAELVTRWNQTDVPRPPGPLVPERIAAVAQRQPDAIALRRGRIRLSYRELRARSVQLAERLAQAGIGRGDRVALLVERSLELVVGLLAVLESGAAYVPLDPDHPAARNDRILAGADVRAIVTSQELRSTVPRGLRAVLVDDATLSSDLPSFDLDETGDLQVDLPTASPEDLAYVIYTSGSTGEPKGVEISHGALDNLIHAMQTRLHLDGDARWLALTTIAFDIAVLELLLPLTVGASVELALRSDVVDTAKLSARLEARDITHVQATPTHWRALVDAGWRGRRDLTVLTGGEALPRDLANSLVRRAGRVHNVYGPTETTVWSSAHLVTADSDAVPIGHPIDNTVMYVVDGHGELAPIGAVGELWIGGAGLARGYFRRPDLTEARFGVDPFRGAPHRVFRTGDLVRRRSDGAIEWIARTDNQVKVRGHRIELGEVEAALMEHEATDAAVVLTTGDPAELVAYVAAPAGARPEALRAFLQERLPSYMVPPQIVVLPELPLTPNGKVDRRALPAPAQAPATAGAAPRDQAERQVAEIWCEVLGRGEVPVDAAFGDLGGHSLHVVQVAERLEALVGRRLSLPDLLRHPTVEAQAAWLRDQSAWSGRGAEAVPLAAGRGPPLFLVCGVHVYLPLAEAMEHSGPVYGLLVPSDRRILDSDSADAMTVEALAAEYRALIEAAAPEGPYLLAGASFGGVLAFEIARQLAADGRDVDLLAMLDSELPSARRRLAGRWLATRLEGFLREPGALSERVKERLWDRSAPPASPEEERERYAEARDRAHDQLTRAYVTRKPTYAGDAVLVRATDVPVDPGYALEADLGWSAHVSGNLHLLRSPGGHLSMLEAPHVHELAKRLRPYMPSRKPLRAALETLEQPRE